MLQYFEIQGSQCFKAATPVSNVMSVCHKPVYCIKYNGTVKNLHGLPAVYMLKFSNIVSSFMILSPNLNTEYVCLNLVKYSCLAHIVCTLVRGMKLDAMMPFMNVISKFCKNHTQTYHDFAKFAMCMVM